MVWDPYLLCNINKIEMIQHRATHFVLGCPWRRDIRDIAQPLCYHHLDGLIYSLEENVLARFILSSP